MGYRLGVDLGTTYTSAAVLRDGHVEIVPLSDHSDAMPSVVYLRPGGGYLVGDAAVAHEVESPHRVAREFKRRIGDPTSISLGGVPMSAHGLTGALLAHVVRTVAAREGGQPDEVVLSCPASWSRLRREMLLHAAELADVDNASLCTEAEAAALQFAATNRLGDGDAVAVYDLGGGTFDAAVLRRKGDAFELAGQPEELEHLGGVDLDAALMAHVCQQLGLEGYDDPLAHPGLLRLREECARAKERLSEDVSATIPVGIPGVAPSVRVTRSELEEVIAPLVEATVDCLVRTVAGAGLTPGELSAVLLVGGSARSPLVSERLTERLGRPLPPSPQPKLCVAMGAARARPGDHRPPREPVPAPPRPVELAPPLLTQTSVDPQRPPRRPWASRVHESLTQHRSRVVLWAAGLFLLVATVTVIGAVAMTREDGPGTGTGPPGPSESGATDDSTNGSEEETDPSTPVRCWRGTAATAADCPTPKGARGLASVFPSFDPDAGCEGPLDDGTPGKAEAVVCKYGDHQIRYSRWSTATPDSERIAHYAADNPGQREPWIIDGERIGWMWFSYEEPSVDPRENRRWQWSGTYLREPFSVSVEGLNSESRAEGVSRVLARPPEDVGLAPDSASPDASATGD